MYDPLNHISPLFVELRRVVGEGLMQAGLAIGLDHANRTPKPWAYYAGVLAGATAIASGIPNASLTIYVAASALDMFIFKSPEGGLVDVFIDGVAATNFTTFAANQIWEAYQVNVNSPDRPVAVEFRTRPTDANGDPVSVNWFSVSRFTPVGGVIMPRAQFREAPPWEVTIASRNSAGRRRSFKLYFSYYVDSNTLELYIRELVEALRPVTVGRFVGATISRPLIDNDRTPAPYTTRGGGVAVLEFSAAFANRTKVNIPFFDETLTYFSNKKRIVQHSDVRVAELIDVLTATGRRDITPVDARGQLALQAYLRGEWRVRS
ncbi:hypothetical protein VZO05_10840 [Aggregatilineales bacterium SYSU G02658]